MIHKSIIRPSVETVIKIHKELISKTGGLHGIRDYNLLDMSVNSPFHTFAGSDLYPTLIDKAAHLAYSLIKNHSFLDGNKRIGVTIMIVFLKSNGFEFDCTNEELAEFGQGIADGSYDTGYINEWIKNHFKNYTP